MGSNVIKMAVQSHGAKNKIFFNTATYELPIRSLEHWLYLKMN